MGPERKLLEDAGLQRRKRKGGLGKLLAMEASCFPSVGIQHYLAVAEGVPSMRAYRNRLEFVAG